MMHLFSFTPPRLRITYSKAIALVAALAPLLASARPDKFTSCHQEKRYQDPYARAECLRESRDARAIPELYAMAREVVAEAKKQGIQGFAGMPNEFNEHADRAGEVAAWSDGAFLAEKARSPDVYDQAFAIQAFNQGLTEAHVSDKSLSQRIRRFRKLREHAQPICQSLTNSTNAHVQACAQECISKTTSEPRRPFSEDKESMRQVLERMRRETGQVPRSDPRTPPQKGMSPSPSSTK